MSQDFDFTSFIRVHDPEALLRAARDHEDAAGMPTEDFYGCDGEIDVHACLVMLLDPGSLPGCEILDSSAHLA